MKPLSAILTLVSFFITAITGPMPAYAQTDGFQLPAPGVMVHLSPPLDPPMLKGIKVHADDPFHFDFILDKGESSLSNDQLKDESGTLIKYFLASLTIPEKDLWVNLSPYEKDRIIPNSFGLTEMGRDLLAEDYMLKQITASLIYPEDKIGRKFWERIYEEAAKKFGTTNIPVNTFNKVWIVPEKAVVYENAKAGTAYVVESKLKVMLEQDYLSLSKHNVSPSAPFNSSQSIGTNIVREIVIPELTREVNEDKNFARLRQVYNSLILATWYKKKIKDSIWAQVYADKNRVAGVNIDDPRQTQMIYERYLKAFKKGVFNYIKEESDPVTQEAVPRKYFSGGVDFATSGDTTMKGIDGAMTVTHALAVLQTIISAFYPSNRVFEVKGNFEVLKTPVVLSVPQGYRLIGGVKDRQLAARLQRTTGLPFALVGPEVYSPFQDNGLTLKFMDVINFYMKTMDPGVIENNVFNILEIGTGSGLGARTAFHWAKQRGFQVNLDAVDITDGGIENARKNFDLSKDEITDKDSVHIFKIKEDGKLNELTGKKYDLILFNAPNAVSKEQLAGVDVSIRMDQDIFKRILQVIGDRLLAKKGVAIIGNQKSIMHFPMPKGLGLNLITGDEVGKAGIYLEGQKESRVFFEMSRDQAMVTTAVDLPDTEVQKAYEKIFPDPSRALMTEESFKYYMAIRERVNPDGGGAVIYGGSGIDLVNVLAATGGEEIFMVDNFNRVHRQMLDFYLELYKSGEMKLLDHNERLYMRRKKENGFSHVEGIQDPVSFLFAVELQSLQPENIVVNKPIEGVPSISFTKNWPGIGERKHTIYFVNADITRPETYPALLRDKIRDKEINGYFQNAGMRLPGQYKEFMIGIANGFKDGKGFAITDDYLGKGMREKIPLIDTLINVFNVQAVQKLPDDILHWISERLQKNDGKGYGWLHSVLEIQPRIDKGNPAMKAAINLNRLEIPVHVLKEMPNPGDIAYETYEYLPEHNMLSNLSPGLGSKVARVKFRREADGSFIAEEIDNDTDEYAGMLPPGAKTSKIEINHVSQSQAYGQTNTSAEVRIKEIELKDGRILELFPDNELLAAVKGSGRIFYFEEVRDERSGKVAGRWQEKDPLVLTNTQEAIKNGWTTLDVVPRDISLETVQQRGGLQATDLLLVHRTDLLPENGIVKTSKDREDGEWKRDELHFSLNHPVVSNPHRSWDHSKYTILIPLWKIPKSRVENFNLVDTWMKAGSLELPQGSIVLGTEPIPNNVNIGKAIYKIIPQDRVPVEQFIKKLGYTVTEGNWWAWIPEDQWGRHGSEFAEKEGLHYGVHFHSESERRERELNSKTSTGGIDLTPANMNLQTQNPGGEIKFHIDAAMLQQLQNASGFYPKVNSVEPVDDLQRFLGIGDPQTQ